MFSFLLTYCCLYLLCLALITPNYFSKFTCFIILVIQKQWINELQTGSSSNNSIIMCFWDHQALVDVNEATGENTNPLWKMLHFVEQKLFLSGQKFSRMSCNAISVVFSLWSIIQWVQGSILWDKVSLKTCRKVLIKVKRNSPRWRFPLNFCLMKLTPDISLRALFRSSLELFPGSYYDG